MVRRTDPVCHSEPQSGVGISWYCVPFRTFPQEIATALLGLAMTVVVEDWSFFTQFSRNYYTTHFLP